MSDIIKLLPDSIANQIAAGEVIQRPASVVKELMENAIDAGAENIKLIIKDAGKTLLQVIDDGCGMSETDARMCFQRHATSKIRKAKDLFAIRTMGFRGEAMASIAAIAQVELKTRKHADELGVRILMEGSEVKTQEACQCAAGTMISVKNLFFNVPARRNFLKSDAVEMRHITDEFQRVALANPDIFFSLHHNGNEIYHLQKGNSRQRIVGFFGNSSNKNLVKVEETTDVVTLNGYVGKPDFAKKTRGDQLLFVNNRFIKSHHLHHAIVSAFDESLQKGMHPFYVLYLDIDPSRIDINVHPTKQEIKFDDDRLIYNYLKVAIRHALAQQAVTPMLDFDQNVNFATGITGRSERKSKEGGTPFTYKSSAGNDQPSYPNQAGNKANWKKLYDGLDEFDETETEGDDNEPTVTTIESQWTDNAPIDDIEGSFSKGQKKPYQIHGSYIINQIKSGYVLINQQAAHERILYERYLSAIEDKKGVTQKEMFPINIKTSVADADIVKELLPQINSMGFDMQEFGKNDFVIHGTPADMPRLDHQQLIDTLIFQYKENLETNAPIAESIAKSMARTGAIKKGKYLTETEMKELIDQLFACSNPYANPFGKKCFLTFELDDLEKQFS
ncbi:MAG: DNA mismatch repair protein MutL [Polaribacter sp.]|jgi:DNA mismatch repair protein MutL